MNRSLNGSTAGYEQFETPFTDIPVLKEQDEHTSLSNQFFNGFTGEIDSPFSRTYEPASVNNQVSQASEEYVDFLGELNSQEFAETIYNLANEVEDSWRNKVNNEMAMGSNYIPFATQQAQQYFLPVVNGTDALIDRVTQHFSGNNLADFSTNEIDLYFESLSYEHDHYSPAQEQFFDKIFNKVKSVVKKGVDLAKKGISAVGKILPIGPVLQKIKGLIKPLLNKVLKFAIGKLPKNLQPHAKTLAKKFLNLETASDYENVFSNEQDSNQLEAIQTELDNHIAQLLFSPGEIESNQLLSEYESSLDQLENEDYSATGISENTPIHIARQQFINELKNLQEGESAAPAIERFLPAAILALQPVIKIAIGIIGRQKVINFLAGLLAKLVGKYVPENVAKPLAASIIDVGMSAIGFEIPQTQQADLAYEAIANTIEETVQHLEGLDEASMNDAEDMTLQLMEAFEKAAASNFPPQYIKPSLRLSKQKGVWVGMPRGEAVQQYKKFTHVYDISIDPRVAATVTAFRGLPIANFLKDKYGLDTSNTIKAKVHLYELKKGSRLSIISRYEKLPGLHQRQQNSWVQLLPLTQQAASLLLNEPSLGRDEPKNKLATRFNTAGGQRFYFLEIEGARLRIPAVNRTVHAHKNSTQDGLLPGTEQEQLIRNAGTITTHDHRTRRIPNTATESRSADIQAVINFIRSEIRINYFFSEEDAKELVEKLNRNDIIGAAGNIKRSVKNLLNKILSKHIGSKVKIIHEAIPELYLEQFDDKEDQFAPFDAIAKLAGNEIISKVIEQLVNIVSSEAFKSILAFFKARAIEFKNAQAMPQDGVTVKITWSKVQGMPAIRAIINAIKGNFSIGSLSDLKLPSKFPTAEIKILADKKFD